MSTRISIESAEGGFYASWSEKTQKDGKTTFAYKKKVFTSQEELAAWVKAFQFSEDEYSTYDVD